VDKSPTKDIDLGIQHHGWGGIDDKFRQVRARAKIEEGERARKARRNKSKTISFPKFKIGEEIILSGTNYRRGRQAIEFYLVEILDIDDTGMTDKRFEYYVLLKKTTNDKYLNRIGRLMHFPGRHWFDNLAPANVENKGIKWLI